jgi:rod shape determining protein RodA
MNYWFNRLLDAIRPRVDWALICLIVLVSATGLAVLYSATDSRTDVIVRQIIRLGVGMAALLALSRMPPRTLRGLSIPLYGGTVVTLVLVAIMGEGDGAQRWLDLGFMRFQPSELMKITLPMAVAAYLHERPTPIRLLDLAVCGVMIAIPVALIVRQPDLGTSLLVLGAGASVIFLAGLSWRLIFTGMGVGLAAIPIIWANMHEYQRNRVRVLLDPESDPLNHGWNIIQSKIAIGSGGLLGKGWQNGTQAHLDFLPERTTDFILSVLAEEFGFLGVSLLMLAYLAIVLRGLYIASEAGDTFSRLLAGSLILTFAVYVIVNAGMVSGILPVVGVPLPLVSYGGTSAVTLLAAFGMIMSIRANPRRRHLSEALKGR